MLAIEGSRVAVVGFDSSVRLVEAYDCGTERKGCGWVVCVDLLGLRMPLLCRSFAVQLKYDTRLSGGSRGSELRCS